jgi:hypothetical protein
MPIRLGGNALKNSSTWRRRSRFRTDDLFGRVDPVNLKYVLGDILTDRGNLRLDGSPYAIRLQRSLYSTSMTGAGAAHHISLGLPTIFATGPLLLRKRTCTHHRDRSQTDSCSAIGVRQPDQPRSSVRQTLCNKVSRSRVERRPRSNACVSKKT